MAIFRTKSANATLLVIFCVLIFQEASGTFLSNSAAADHVHSRKVLADLKVEIVKGGGGIRNSPVSSELRTAPSGPDPLHHNGGGPKKPRTP